MSEKERADVQVATLYNVRLTIQHSEKETYTKSEILELLDTIATEKKQ